MGNFNAPSPSRYSKISKIADIDVITLKGRRTLSENINYVLFCILKTECYISIKIYLSIDVNGIIRRVKFQVAVY